MAGWSSLTNGSGLDCLLVRVYQAYATNAGNDMQSPDLLKLFLVVREIGGYEFVSKKGLWAFVVKELGLDLEVSASVKLIYAKYLHELEKWLKKRNREGSDVGNFGFLSLEHEEELGVVY
ncbi:hypothetical protein ERO13_D08G197620v2 [Gossypium hirsutum]|nr:hypothetical protein ERO13_D08G197620v2 [Gossypium hirsutum]